MLPVALLVLDELKGLDAAQIKFRAIGQALGLPATAEALTLGVENRLEEVLAAAANDSPLRVPHLYIRRGGLQLASAVGNEAQTIIEAAGGIDAAAEVGIVGWRQLTPEALVAADSDVRPLPAWVRPAPARGDRRSRAILRSDSTHPAQ